MKAKVTVKLKDGVLDPQGKAVLNAAHSLGYPQVEDVKLGRVFFLEIGGKSPEDAQAALKELGEKLLANTVIENFEIEIL